MLFVEVIDVLLKIVLATDMVEIPLWRFVLLVCSDFPLAICKEDMVQFIDLLDRLLVRLALLLGGVGAILNIGFDSPPFGSFDAVVVISLVRVFRQGYLYILCVDVVSR